MMIKCNIQRRAKPVVVIWRVTKKGNPGKRIAFEREAKFDRNFLWSWREDRPDSGDDLADLPVGQSGRKR